MWGLDVDLERKGKSAKSLKKSPSFQLSFTCIVAKNRMSCLRMNDSYQLSTSRPFPEKLHDFSPLHPTLSLTSFLHTNSEEELGTFIQGAMFGTSV